MSLDGKVSSYLPVWDDSKVEVIASLNEGETDTVKASRPIAIRDLLCHTSGLSYGFLCSSPEVRSDKDLHILVLGLVNFVFVKLVCPSMSMAPLAHR